MQDMNTQHLDKITVNNSTADKNCLDKYNINNGSGKGQTDSGMPNLDNQIFDKQCDENHCGDIHCNNTHLANQGNATVQTFDTEKELFWQGIFKQYSKTQEPIRVFCRKNNLREAQFYYWRKKFRDENKKTCPSPEFAEITLPKTNNLSSESDPLDNNQIDIRLTSGNKLRIGNGVSLQRIAAIIKMLSC
jgi:transposase-like protein